MDLVEQLRGRLSAFDGKSPSILGEVEVRFQAEAGYMDALVALSADPDPAVSSGATWLIKARLERGETLRSQQTARLVSGLDGVTVWDAQLHICQSVRFLKPGLSTARSLAKWLEPLLTHRRPFLRAWALDALCHLASEYDAHKEMANDCLKRAGEDQAASVRARARLIEKELVFKRK